MRVTITLALDTLRRRRRLLFLGREQEDGSVSLGEERLILLAALRSLPRRQREVVVMRYLVDMSERETSQALGIAPGGVKRHAYRGLGALRSILGPDSQEALRALG